MSEDKLIRQEKTDNELVDVGNEIIKLLEPFNRAEKYKIVSSLYGTLKNILMEEGNIIFEEDKEKKKEARG